MNFIRTIKIIKRFQKLFTIIEEGQKKMGKNIIKSKVFWFNILTAAAELMQVIPLPAGTAILIVNGINIALRLITKEPVTVLPNS